MHAQKIDIQAPENRKAAQVSGFRQLNETYAAVSAGTGGTNGSS
jgi:hypothetical protein